MARHSVSIHLPPVSSPLNPTQHGGVPPQRSLRRFRRIKGIKKSSSLSLTQRLLRQKAAEAWTARRDGVLHVSVCPDHERDLGEASIVTLTLDETRSLAQFDRLIGAKIHTLDRSGFDVDLEALEKGPRSSWRVSDRFPILTARRFALALGTLCIYWIACLDGIFRRPYGKLS